MTVREARVEGPGYSRLLGYYRGTPLTGGEHLTRGVRTQVGFYVVTRDVPPSRLGEAEAQLQKEDH